LTAAVYRERTSCFRDLALQATGLQGPEQQQPPTRLVVTAAQAVLLLAAAAALQPVAVAVQAIRTAQAVLVVRAVLVTPMVQAALEVRMPHTVLVYWMALGVLPGGSRAAIPQAWLV
jgi:hypothetical protein